MHTKPFAYGVTALALASGLAGTALLAPSAAALPAHRSIWAVRWHKAHPGAAHLRHSARHVAWHPASHPHHARPVAFKPAPQIKPAPKSAVHSALQSVSAGAPVRVASLTLSGILAPKPKAIAVKAITRSADDVTLDFVSADINDVLKALAMQTHTNIVSGNDVKGSITVSLAHVSLEEALDLIAKLSGYQYAKVGKTYIVGTPATIQMLTASGTAQSPPVTAVIAFRYSDPTNLSDAIKELLPNLKATTGKSASSQTGGVLVITGTEADVESARHLITDSETMLSRNIQASRTEMYKIKYASADDLQTVLNRLVPGIIITPAPTQGFTLQAPATADAGSTTSSTTSYGAAAAPAGGTTTSVTTSIAAKPTTNALLLTGSDADITHALQVLTTVDVRPLQINYEAKIIETSMTNANELGLTYDFSGARTTIGELLQPGDTPSSTVFKIPYPGNILKGETFGRTPISALTSLQLHALFTSEDTKLLAAPNISAVDGQPAATFVGDTVSYISSVTQSPTGQNITTSTVNAGIKLFVTGKVNNDGYITMNIHPEVSLVTLSAAGAGGVQVPDVRVREATTTVRVKDGSILAIGGLINDQIIKDVQKVPILGDLPFFGNLFRNTKKTHTHDDVMIFIKVSIQKDPA